MAGTAAVTILLLSGDRYSDLFRVAISFWAAIFEFADNERVLDTILT
jgi:hypothetical protein